MPKRPAAGKGRACIDKRRYDTKQEAEDVAERTARQYPASLPRAAYACPFARKNDKHFHVGRPLGVHAEARC